MSVQLMRKLMNAPKAGKSDKKYVVGRRLSAGRGGNKSVGGGKSKFGVKKVDRRMRSDKRGADASARKKGGKRRKR